ncbi:hypothetical protein BO70DRAFT_343954 [Aspergillus heteromorphus CBS 117.55]|uniref:DUF7702 domain-containing protein n=1 Tax=Aspergillus heteromorphus CBS 117.55 TaxID=1448321 RepID=A0A317VA05_9EURO|nr:uncharacterized protein BO70DRAFT_343954 [Aspergillus heteromorphus CBS 117.55]PWY69702.1 hypothetical protein BO70DRAFT_343954 [Aspergillus heteromorphus CBS 117.55]
MAIVTSDGVAIAELVVYIPTALVTIVVVLRHGFHRQLGWIYLCIFCALRIGGAIMEILSEKHPDNANDKEWATILQSVGLSPLLLSTLGLLKRIFDEITQHVPSGPESKHNIVIQLLSAYFGIFNRLIGIYSKRATAVSRRSRVVQLLHIPSIIALALAISGGTDQASSDVSEHAGGKTQTRAAIIIFLAIYIATCLLWSISLSEIHIMVSSQRRIYRVVAIALPLIAVRLLYSLLGDFGKDNSQFSIVDGSVAIRLCMATIEEFLVVLMYTILGVVTPRSTDVLFEDPRGSSSRAAAAAAAVPRRPVHGATDTAYHQVSYAEAAAQSAQRHYGGR